MILILSGVGVWWAQDVRHRVSDTAPATTVGTVKPDSPYVEINGVEIPVEIAQTQAEVEKGLSGRASLDSKRGMLFIFSQPDYYRFWMPDMNFPIDIIWIREDRIVGISTDVSNEFDPAKPKFYTPSQPADKVLEVNAGFTVGNNIKVGDSIIFNNEPNHPTDSN